MNNEILENENSSILMEMLSNKQDQLIKYNLRKRFLNLNLFLAEKKPSIELNMYTK